MLGVVAPTRSIGSLGDAICRIRSCSGTSSATLASDFSVADTTEHWLVHPWGARPRANGRQPEPTGDRFHAQDGGSRRVKRGVLTVQLPPRAPPRGPGSQIRGFVHFHLVPGSGGSRVPRRTRLSPLLRRDYSSCGCGCSSQSPKSRRCARAINLRQFLGVKSRGVVYEVDPSSGVSLGGEGLLAVGVAGGGFGAGFAGDEGHA